MSATRKWLSAAEVAKLEGVSHHTVCDWCRYGYIFPAEKVGHQYVIGYPYIKLAMGSGNWSKMPPRLGRKKHNHHGRPKGSKSKKKAE